MMILCTGWWFWKSKHEVDAGGEHLGTGRVADLAGCRGVRRTVDQVVAVFELVAIQVAQEQADAGREGVGAAGGRTTIALFTDVPVQVARVVREVILEEGTRRR